MAEVSVPCPIIPELNRKLNSHDEGWEGGLMSSWFRRVKSLNILPQSLFFLILDDWSPWLSLSLRKSTWHSLILNHLLLSSCNYQHYISGCLKCYHGPVKIIETISDFQIIYHFYLLGSWGKYKVQSVWQHPQQQLCLQQHQQLRHQLQLRVQQHIQQQQQQWLQRGQETLRSRFWILIMSLLKMLSARNSS